MRVFHAWLPMLVGAYALIGSRAHARELDYRAPEGCPSRAAMEARIAARTGEGRDASVEVRAVGLRFLGQVTLGAGEERVVRSVEAQSCGAALDAIALIIALDRKDE